MDFFSIVEKRRSIRKYSERPIEQETIDQIMESALRAPSSRGLQPWEFVVVTDEGIIEKLSKSKEHGSAFLQGAPLAVVVCADVTKCDVWIEDASIASTFIILAAQALGLGSCWIQMRERKHVSGRPAEEYIREVLDLPKNLRIVNILALGYPGEEKPAHALEDLPFGKVMRR